MDMIEWLEKEIQWAEQDRNNARRMGDPVVVSHYTGRIDAYKKTLSAVRAGYLEV